VRRARQIAFGLLAAEVVVLIVTGIALYFRYRPTAAQAWNQPLLQVDIQQAGRIRIVHHVASTLALYTSVIAAVLLLVGGRAGRWRWIGLPILVAAVSYTGYLLPWDQLALWAVTVGTNLDGYGALFGDQVKFVIIDGVEISPGTLISWLLVHMLVLGPAVAVLVGFGWRRASKPDGVT
jgi:quinol-cytochrome oxidoreductase complex cytochrome b subunit